MDVSSILTPQVVILLVVSGTLTNALVIGSVVWGVYKLAPAVANIPNAIDTLRMALTTRLEALENKVSDIEAQLHLRKG
ncbi:MAG: hypothetical protein ACKO34_03560 [Vampirovibrionales bacterium]